MSERRDTIVSGQGAPTQDQYAGDTAKGPALAPASAPPAPGAPTTPPPDPSWPRASGDAPPLFRAGDRAEITDHAGKRYLDATGGHLHALHGHGRPEIDHAITQALRDMACGPGLLAGASVAELARKLAALAPSELTRVLLTSDAPTAKAAALEAARAATGRKEILELGGTGAPLPYCYRCPIGKSFPGCKVACADEVAATVRGHKRKAAALVVEPALIGAVLARPPAGWLARLRAACDEHGVLLIADESADGLGRSGALFACEREGVVPDILVLGSSLAGGYAPIGAVLAKESIALASPGLAARDAPGALACAAALGNLFVLESNHTLDKLAGRIDALAERLGPLAGLSHVGQVRHRGLRAAVELVADKETRAAYPPEEGRGRKVAGAALERGLLVDVFGDVVALSPPLTVTDEELDAMVGRLEEAILAALPNNLTNVR